MDFRTELAKWGYNKGNSIDVETLVDEILPELFSKQENNKYSEKDMKTTWDSSEQNMRFTFSSSAYRNISFKQWLEKFKNK